MVSRRRAEPPRSLILKQLPAGEQCRFAAQSESVDVVAGDVLCRAGAVLSHVYFPNRGVVSVFGQVAGGRSIGVGLVGKNGLFGLSAAVGRRRSELHAFSQGAGQGERMKVLDFGRLLDDCPSLRTAVSVYAVGRASQMARDMACVAFHSSRQRVARWMLDVTDGRQAPQFLATQADIAAALGMQRPAVSRIATALQRSGYIGYSRGNVRILERAALKTIAFSWSPRSAMVHS